MPVYFLLSGFYLGTDISNDVVNVIKKHIKKRNRFTYIATEMEEHEKNDLSMTDRINWLSEMSIIFKKSTLIDSRIDQKKRKDIIQNADCIFLGGGDTLQQYNFLAENDLIKELQMFGGVIMGSSAGAINMAKKSLAPKSILREKAFLYDGLGLVDYTVIPHIDKKPVHPEVLDLIHDMTVYGLHDNSIIVVQSNLVEFFGKIDIIKNGKINRFNV